MPDSSLVANSDSQSTLLDQFSRPESTEDEQMRAVVALQGRRFCVSTDGYFGIVPKGAKEHDWICVLSENHTPFVLREVENGYTLIGDCYVQGLMEGVAIKMVEERQLKFEMISLIRQLPIQRHLSGSMKPNSCWKFT